MKQAAAAGRDGRRLARGMVAQIVATLARFASQLVVLPILFAAWDAPRVGTWLLLVALPTTFAIFATGFAGAGGNACLAAWRDGKKHEARGRFAASWIMATATSAALSLLFIAAAAAVLVMPSDRVPELLLGASAADRTDIARALALLGLYMFSLAQFALLDIPFRLAGRYGDHMLIAALGLMGDVLAIALALSIGEGYTLVAGTMAVGRLVVGLATFVWARRLVPDLFGGPRTRFRPAFKDIAGPSLALMLLPLALGLNLQGYALAVGFAFGPAVLAAFAMTRTLVRLLDVATGLLFSFQFYEAGYWDADRTGVRRRQLATMTLVTLLLSGLFAAMVLLAGPFLQTRLSDGDTRFASDVALVLLAAGTMRALAVNPIALLAADNRLAHLPVLYCVTSLVALALAALAGAVDLPLWLTLTPLIVVEAMQAALVFRAVLRDLDETWAAFLRRLASRERWSDCRVLAGRIASGMLPQKDLAAGDRGDV